MTEKEEKKLLKALKINQCVYVGRDGTQIITHEEEKGDENTVVKLLLEAMFASPKWRDSVFVAKMIFEKELNKKIDA